MINLKQIAGLLTIVAFFLTLLTPKAAYSSPWAISLIGDPPDNRGKVMSLKAGDKAPFAGVLLDETAAAKVQVEKENEEAKCQIKVDKEVGLVNAELNLKLANEKAARMSAQKELIMTRSIKEDQIRFLTNELVKNQKKNKRDLTGLWVVVGGVSAILIGVSSAYIYKQVH